MAKFKDMIDTLVVGKKVRRGIWPTDLYIYMPNTNTVVLWSDDPKSFSLSIEDLCADDWEVVEPTVAITRKHLDGVVLRTLLDGGIMPDIALTYVRKIRTHLGL